jgi:hypothetical protein
LRPLLRLAALLTLTCACAVASAPAGAIAQPSAPLPPLSTSPSASEPYVACPPASQGRASCYTVVVPPAAKLSSISPFASGATGGVGGSGLAPAELQSAYKLPSASAGSGQTVAIVDAYDDPKAESDLAAYRSAYGLPACTEGGGCFRKVNQAGGKSYPAVETGWNVEESLDLDMVSAICPNCHILLVEANSNSFADLAAAENEAASLGASAISNSWGAPESSGDASMDSAFHHPGIPITVASGDYGYDNHEMGANTPSYPASSPEVIAVGGTVLAPASNARGWSESVWPRSGSGCSLLEAKPWFQTDGGCAKRTTNDVAAVAEDLSIYDTSGEPGWFPVGGTSAATPIIAAVEALSESAERSLGAQGIYQSPGSLFHVASGSNGNCTLSYLCSGGGEYNGPTGRGTPDGALALSVSTPAPTVSDFSPASGPVGTKVTITGANLNGPTAVAFNATRSGSYTVESPTQLSATVPAGASSGPISVTTPGGTAASRASFTVTSPAPTVASVSPAEGPTSGGMPITITGTHFLSGATVNIGGKLATAVTVRSETEIAAKTPEKEAGSYEVTVSDANGTSSGGAKYTYLAPQAPSVSAIAPASGSTSGGSAVTITGAHFLAGAMVKIGGKNALGLTVRSETEITAKTPEKEAGSYEVTVSDSAGTSSHGPKYTYVAPPLPVVSAVTPAQGSTFGGSAITITGAHFLSGATVRIGAKNALGVTVRSETEITARTPEKEAGAYEVSVSDANGTSKGGPKFTYIAPPPPTVTALSPAEGPTSGGNLIAITGTHFTSGATVKIGGKTALGLTVRSETELTVKAPEKEAGSYELTVADAYGTSKGGPRYTYVAYVAVAKTAAVKVSCAAGKSCSGTVTLAISGASAAGVGHRPARSTSLGSASFSIAAGRSAVVRVPLNGKGRAMLRAAHGHLGATLEIAGAAGSQPLAIVHVELRLAPAASDARFRHRGAQVAVAG